MITYCGRLCGGLWCVLCIFPFSFYYMRSNFTKVRSIKNSPQPTTLRSIAIDHYAIDPYSVNYYTIDHYAIDPYGGRSLC